MKKLLSIIAVMLIAFMLATALAACGEGGTTDNGEDITEKGGGGKK